MQNILFTESCLALYDLKVDRHFDTNFCYPYNGDFLRAELKSGLTILIRADGYYVFDFSDANIAKPFKIESADKRNRNNSYIRSQRIEVIHAFLACLRYTTQQKTRCFHILEMDFIDNFIICSQQKHELESIIDDPNAFSTWEYQSLCRKKLEHMKQQETHHNINNIPAIDDAVKILEKVMLHKEVEAVCILGILYRVAVYCKLKLEIHAVIFLRSALEWLCKKHNISSNNKNKFDIFLNDFGIRKGSADYANIETLRNMRNRAIHELEFPKYEGTTDCSILLACFKIIQKIYCQKFEINISIPIGQTQFHCLEPVDNNGKSHFLQFGVFEFP